MSNDELSKILGYEPSREQRLQIMRYARDHQIPPGEAAARFSLPAMLFVNDDGNTFEHEGENLTPEELKAKYPYNRFVFIRS